MKSNLLLINGVLLVLLSSGALSEEPPRAARSVHLWYPAPDSLLFYNEMTVEESVPGSYFMACGWNTGYFGIQELYDGKKVVIFSVWDPTRGDDPKAVPDGERVECLHEGENVRIKRFGGEGTGGQCMADLPWESGETYRFAVKASIEGEKTAYSGFVGTLKDDEWRHLVTFRTRTGGMALTGLYSFVEDFKRDYKSADQVRRASYANTWVRTVDGELLPMIKARFTASSASWEAQDSINAGMADGAFFLVTGGETKKETPLQSFLELAAPAMEAPPKNSLP